MGLVSLPPVPGLTYKREYFASSSTFTLPMSAQNKFDAILVSGGGGGGRSPFNGANYVCYGGGGAFVYMKDVFCTNGTTLTVTIGAGGAGAIQSSAQTNGADGNVSTISGIVGNGVSTSISSPIAALGFGANSDQATTSYRGNVSPQTSSRMVGNSYNTDRNGAIGVGVGNFSKGSGNTRLGVPRTVFQSANSIYQSSIGSQSFNDASGNTGGPIPLLANYLHSAVGGTGTTGTSGGATGTANTFFAGGGGGGRSTGINQGVGGGGGCGGLSTTGGTLGGTGGNGAANSGGGGGGGGKNTVTGTNTGSGGAGGSGFIIIGYWG
jgi:hypothetical protein